jgi:hypothetical protein
VTAALHGIKWDEQTDRPRGSLFTLRRKQALQDANITHVLSVLRLPLDQELFKGFKHMLVEVDDVEDENLLEHFKTTNAFIQEGLDSGGGVLVHWYVSSFATLICCTLLLRCFPFELAFGGMAIHVIAEQKSGSALPKQSG